MAKKKNKATIEQSNPLCSGSEESVIEKKPLFDPENGLTPSGWTGSPAIEVLHPICCGLDIHKKKITACLMITEPNGLVRYEFNEFGTTTKRLYELLTWLEEYECPIVTMESTGIFWRPVFNILEGHLKVLLVNPKYVKNVPGRKTDISDSQWIAELLRIGLIRGSFIPDKQIRQWRDLVTVRKNYKDSANDFKRRVHKLFETANIKISTVATDIFGKTGRNIMELLLDPDAEITKDQIVACARGSLTKKVSDLYECIQGFFEEHHRFQLKLLLETIDDMEAKAAQITARLDEQMQPYKELMERLIEVPGIDKLAAQSILAHVGTTLDAFANMNNFVSWAGLCPGNNESAGKRKSGKSPVHKHPFKTLMVEVAWAAKNKKNSYYRVKFYSLKGRIGPKKAAVAIAHKIAMAIYHIIKNGQTYQELGADYLSKRNAEKRMAYLKKQAKQLGMVLVEG